MGLSHHAVSRPKEGEDWQYSTGYINEDMIRERLFPAGPTTFAGICGPPAMVNAACLPNLQVHSQALAVPCRTLLQFCQQPACMCVQDGHLRTHPASLRAHWAGSQSSISEHICAVSRQCQLPLTTPSVGHSRKCIHAPTFKPCTVLQKLGYNQEHCIIF